MNHQTSATTPTNSKDATYIVEKASPTYTELNALNHLCHFGNYL